MRIALATHKKLPEWEIDDRPLHRALADRGVEVVQSTWDDPDFDWGGCAGCLIRTTWDYVPRHREFVEWARRAARATRLFNPPEIVEWNTHKGYLRDLEIRDIPVIPTIWLKAGGHQNEWRESLSARGWRRAFLKPVVGASACDTLRFESSPDGLKRAEDHLKNLTPGRPMILQPYLDRVETEGEYSIILFDGEPSHAVRKYPVAGDYRVQDDHGGKDEPFKLEESVITLSRRIVKMAEQWLKHPADRPLLYARIDLLRDDAGEFRLTELELVEPSLFFRHSHSAAETLADALLRRLR